MAVMVDLSDSLGGGAVTQTTLSWSHTCGAGCSLLVVGAGNTTNKTVSSVTYGGVALSFGASVANGTNREVEAWSLVSPTPGTATITITWSAGARVCGGAISFLGTNVATPFGTLVTATGSTNPANVTVTPADLTLDLLLIANGAAETLTPDASQTQQVNVTGNTGGGVNTAVLGMSIKAAGATMQWTQSGSGSPSGYAMIGIPIFAAAGGLPWRPGGRIYVQNQAAINRASRY